MSLKRIFVAELLGTAFLLMIVVGSGIMGETLADGNQAFALLANSVATGAGLFVLIQCLGPISGAHLNPIVSGFEFLSGRIEKRYLFSYLTAQFFGAIIGVLIAHVLFHQEIIQVSMKDRAGLNLFISEIVATFGLLCTIVLGSRKRPESTALNVASYITSAYWFTSSTSFANSAVTVARMFTNTFCGIRPDGVFPFVLAQLLGLCIAFFILKMVSKEEKM